MNELMLNKSPIWAAQNKQRGRMRPAGRQFDMPGLHLMFTLDFTTIFEKAYIAKYNKKDKQSKIFENGFQCIKLRCELDVATCHNSFVSLIFKKFDNYTQLTLLTKQSFFKTHFQGIHYFFLFQLETWRQSYKRSLVLKRLN
jgi:hypothetical protein